MLIDCSVGRQFQPAQAHTSCSHSSRDYSTLCLKAFALFAIAIALLSSDTNAQSFFEPSQRPGGIDVITGAPFNGLLAERVEAHFVGDVSQPAPSWLTLIKSVSRLMGSELSKLLYLFICIVPLLILQFVPLINFVAPLLLFLFGAWMFALEYMDYPMGNHGALFRDVRTAMRKRRKVACGFGSCVAFLSTVPIINLVIMPVAGATALYVDYFRQE